MTDIQQLEREHEVCLRLAALADSMLAGDYGLTTDHQRLAFAFASKSSKSYLAVLRLVEQGLGEPALIIVRTIFEDLVNLAYIGTDPERLAKLFLDFHILEKKKYIDYWEEAGLENDAVKLLKKRWETEFKSDYNRVLPNYPKRTYWSGRNLKEMAAHDPELRKMYCMLYPYVSGFAHGGSPLALASYVDFDENAPVKSLAAPSDAELSEALVAAFSLFIKCLKIFATANNVGVIPVDELYREADKVFHGPAAPLVP